MKISKVFAVFGTLFLLINIIGEESPGTALAIKLAQSPKTDLLKNVSVVEPEIVTAVSHSLEPAAETFAPTPEEIPEADLTVPSPQPNSEIMETYIPGGMNINNNTEFEIDVTEFLSIGPQLKLVSDGPQILIMHTHGSEAYTPAGLDRYEESDDRRTEDTEYNVIRIGEELTKLLEEYGLWVIHDKEIHDYPSYTGSYTRAEQAIQKQLKDNPSISIVLDVHRDALNSDSVIYKTMADESGVCASQIMMLCGSNASGLQHDNWQKNFGLAVYLQQAVNAKHPTLMRPVSLVKERYNTHLTNGSIIVEVGSSGNTLQEALAAIRLYADAIGPALLNLVENKTE